MQKEGTIGIFQPDKKNYVIHFCAKYFEEPSENYGLDDGIISKLSLKLNGEQIANYDSVGDIEATYKVPKICCSILLNTYN